MIGQLNGILLEKNPPQVLVDCGGVGYEVDVPMSTFYQLPQTGERVKLLIHFVVREDAQILYGFSTPQEKAAFKQLVKISGVGPRTALGVLSGMSVQELTHAIVTQESARLTKIPGIGKKTAERLLLELKGKMADAIAPEGQGITLGVGDHKQNDILSALVALGYSERDAVLALKALPADIGVSDGIKAALRAISK
jgi:Holliday junction DNA helicase RuvA